MRKGFVTLVQAAEAFTGEIITGSCNEVAGAHQFFNLPDILP